MFIREEYVEIASRTAVASQLLPEISAAKSAGTYLFEGQDTLLSASLAAYLACSSAQNPKACLKRFLAGNLPDVMTFGENGLKKDDADAVSAAAQASPLELSMKYFILDFSNANESAQNKLLKVLEDVPKSAVFFLVASSPSDSLATIRSRCKIFSPVARPEDVISLAAGSAIPLARCLGRSSITLYEGINGGGKIKNAEAALAFISRIGGKDGMLAAVSVLPKQRDDFKETMSFAESIVGMIISYAGGTETDTFGAFDLPGLSRKFTIVSAAETGRIIREAVRKSADANITSLGDVVAIKITEVLENAQSSRS